MVAPTAQPQVAENSREEAALLEALVGVQGRGRSASKTQLLVIRCTSLILLFLTTVAGFGEIRDQFRALESV